MFAFRVTVILNTIFCRKLYWVEIQCFDGEKASLLLLWAFIFLYNYFRRRFWKNLTVWLLYIFHFRVLMSPPLCVTSFASNHALYFLRFTRSFIYISSRFLSNNSYCFLTDSTINRMPFILCIYLPKINLGNLFLFFFFLVQLSKLHSGIYMKFFFFFFLSDLTLYFLKP